LKDGRRPAKPATEFPSASEAPGEYRTMLANRISTYGYDGMALAALIDGTIWKDGRSAWNSARGCRADLLPCTIKRVQNGRTPT